MQDGGNKRRVGESRIGRPVIPPTGPEADSSRERICIIAEVVIECVRANLEERRHVYLSLAGIGGEKSVQFGVFERATDALLVGRCVDECPQSFSNANAYTLFANAVGTHDHEQTATIWRLGYFRVIGRVLAYKLGHACASALALHLFPTVAVVCANFAERYAHVGTCLYDLLLGWESILGCQICRVEIAYIEFLLSTHAAYYVNDIRSKERVLDMHLACSKVTAVKDALEFGPGALTDLLLEQEQRATRAVVC
jgi:hypothetical protein